MRKSIMLFAMLIAAVAAMANPVSQQVARQVAQTWMQAQGMKNVAALQDITVQTPFTEFYVFAAPEGGFVLVSADDCVQPILGYSVSGHFETKDMPQHVRGFLTGYEEEIRWWKNNGKRDLPLGETPLMAAQGGNGDVQHPALWQELLGGAVPAPPLTTAVSPLLTTTWNQSPYYNSMCPSDSRGQSVTGCVATATAQVMKYHNHPQQGYGSHTYTSTKTVEGETYTYSNLSANFGTTTYQWSSMPNELTSGSSSAQVNAVAQLMYHIGVADEMYYSPVESGAQNYYAGEIASRRASSQESLARYFKYRPDMAAVERGFYDNATFCALLRNELDQQRPILYSGSDVVGGHSFVICGYDNNGLFYVNWGWGGYQDGHYAMGSLNPGEGGTGGNATYTFNLDNVALIGIRPNTSWSTSGTTTVTASMQGVAGGSVSVYDRTSGNAGSSYSFGDTVVLRASLPEGYRFSGWSDGSTFNPREILATGGTYSFTANAVAIGGGDTVGYCTGSSIQSYSSYAGGVKLPASALDVSKQMTEVLFYAYNPGVYDITVYTGANHETTAATASLSVTNDMADAWQSVTLPTPVAATSDIWIIISSTDSGVWPVCLTTYSGVPSSLLLYVNDVIYEYGEYWGRSAMVKGVFHGDVEVSGDTVSYCGNNDYASAVGNGNGGTFQWGIMLPSGSMNNNYLKSVILYVNPGQTGNYTLNIYRGGDTVPGALAHTQTVNFTAEGWQEAQLDAAFAIDNQNLWITFTATGTYMMTGCGYTGALNSNWLNNGGTWVHVTDFGLNYSWLIKAVLSATPPSSYPPPTIAINGQTRLGTGMAYTYTATATSGATVSWSFLGANPASATGATATTTWSTPGYYQVIAAATNSYGTGRDTLWVQVVDYTVGDTLSYIHGDMHLTNVGTGGSTAFSWGIMMPPAFIGNRTQISGIQAGLYEVGTYTLTIYQGGNDAPQTQVATYTFNTTAADTAAGSYFTYMLPTPLTISNSSNLWVVIGSTDLEYPAGSVYHIDDPNSDWTQLNGSWYHLPQLGIDGSWEIKILTGAGSTPQPTQYTITVGSNNNAWGTVTGGGTYNSGATVTLTATANTGYRFVQWQDGNTQNPRTITVTGNATYTATFEAIPPTQYTITVGSNNSAWGTVTGGGTYNSGATVTLTATANTGYHFVQWQDGNTQNPRTITVTGNATYTATFEADGTPQPTGDTVSYCGNSAPQEGGVGTNSTGTKQWGIMLPANMMTNNYLKSVMLYVLDGYTGAYTLNIYRGGDTVPGTLAHSQVVNFTSSGWQEAQLDAVFALNSQNLWITFSTTGMTYPMSVCDYTGSPNSDWYTLNGTTWNHVGALNYSWLIKAVTSQTPPSSFPPPTVAINGQTRLGTGVPYTFTATATDGANVTWTLQGATPATGTGSTVTATWSTSGYYQVIATATNSYGTGRDTLWVQVVDYTVGDTLSYIHGDIHLTNVGTGSASAFSWGIMMPPAFIGNRTQITGVQAGLAEIGTYTLTIYQGGNDAPGTQVATYTFNTTAADTAAGTYFTYTLPTPLAINNASNLWVVIGSTDLAYPAGTVYHIDDPNSDWTQLGGSWYHLPQLGINGSWEIKILTNAGSTPQPTQYTITVASNNNAWGTVTGGGTYNSGATATLTATPTSGYRFVSWNDSNTQNPRTVTVTGNATYIATFEAIPPTQYTVSLNIGWLYGYAPGYYDTNDVYVTGAGTYVEGTEVTITASWGMADYICFVSWVTDEGDTLQGETYTFTVTRDISFTALYTACGGIEDISGSVMSLTPNPATDYAVVSDIKAGAEVSVVDINGKVRYSGTAQSDRLTIDVSSMAAGVYFVRVSDGAATVVRKLIVK